MLNQPGCNLLIFLGSPWYSLVLDFTILFQWRHCEPYRQRPLRALLCVYLQAPWKPRKILILWIPNAHKRPHQNLDVGWLFLQLSDVAPTVPSSFRTMRYFINNWPDLCFMTMQGDRCVGASRSCIHNGCIFELIQKSLVLHDLHFQPGHWGVLRLSFASWTRTGVERRIEAFQTFLLGHRWLCRGRMFC